MNSDLSREGRFHILPDLILATLTFLVLAATPLQAQRLTTDPDWCITCSDTWQHLGSGAAINLSTKIIFPRAKSWQRMAVNVTINTIWELAQADAARTAHVSGPGLGFGIKDLLFGIAGGLLMEKIL